MFCENCGAQISDTAKFCKFCGASQTPANASGTVAPVPAPSAGQAKEKQALIDYLGALYTAEMGVVHSNDLITQLSLQKGEYEFSHERQWRAQYFTESRPVHIDYYAKIREEIESLQSFVDHHKKLHLKGKDIFNKYAEMKTYPFSLSVARQSEKHLVEAQNRLRTVVPNQQKQEDARYARACADYERRMKEFNHREALRKKAWDEEGKAVCKSFDDSIADIIAKRDEFIARRDELYSKGNLYEQFRNPMAEYHLQNYLKMGLVDRLEGPQGGYSFYLDELHAERICGSIKELQTAMEQKLDTIIDKMKTVANQLQRANQMLYQLNTNLNECCNAINTGFERTNSSIEGSADSLSAQLRSEIANQTRPIRESVQRSEYNIYLDSLRKELDNYQYGMLRNPTIGSMY